MPRSFLALLMTLNIFFCTLQVSASNDDPTFESLLRELDQNDPTHSEESRKDGLPSKSVPLDDLYREFNEKKKAKLSLAELRYTMLYENATEQAKNAESELESAKRKEENIKTDLKKFEEISNSPFDKEFTTKAWSAFLQKYPNFFTELNIGEIQAVRNIVKSQIKSKREKLEGHKNFVDYLVNHKGEIVQKFYSETQPSNDSIFEESLRPSMENLKNEKAGELKAVSPTPLQEEILKDFEKLKMKDSLPETLRKDVSLDKNQEPLVETQKPKKPKAVEVDLLKELEQLAKLEKSPALVPGTEMRGSESAESIEKSRESFDSIIEKFDSLPVESWKGDSYVFAKKAGVPDADIQSLYVGLVQEKIYKNWREPLAEEHNQETVVSFFIFPRGNIDKPFVKKSSGVEALDTLAVRAVLDSVPFPEFPDELKMSNLNINIYFKYVPKENNLKSEKKIASERALPEKRLGELDSLKRPANKKYELPNLESFKFTSSKFFVSTRKTKEGNWTNKISNFVPLNPENTCYTWVVSLDTHLNAVQVKEVFKMPSRPSNSNFPSHYTFGEDGKSIIGRIKKEIKNNQISNSWCVAKGDPSGKHNIDVFIEGKFIKSFPFTVGGEETPSFSSQPERNKFSGENSNNDLHQYSEYSTLTNDLYSQFMEIITNSSDIDNLSESLLGGNITSEYAINQKNILSAKTELKVNSFNKNMIEFAPPSFSTPLFIRLANDFNAYLKTLPMQAKESVDLSYKMFDAAIDQNFELYNEIDMRSRNSFLSMLEGENNLINLRKINLNSNSPGYKFYSVIQHSNNSLINVTKARLSEFFSNSPSNELDYLTGDSQAYIRIAEIELSKGRDIVNSSNLVINTWVSKQRVNFSKLPQNIKIFELLGQSLTKSFEVEKNVIDVIQVLISEYPNVESIDKADILLGEFMDQRMSFQQERARLLSKFKN